MLLRIYTTRDSRVNPSNFTPVHTITYAYKTYKNFMLMREIITKTDGLSKKHKLTATFVGELRIETGEELNVQRLA